MTDEGKRNVLGVMVNAIDYAAVVSRVIEAARERRPLGVTALAVHGVISGYRDPEHGTRLNRLDVVVPDGQPVRWALNFLHGADLPDRVYGPTLMLRLCAEAARLGLPIYLYGSTPEVLERLSRSLYLRFPTIQIAGSEPSKFRRLSEQEAAEVTDRIVTSGARITFVGLGCPRQEVWTYEYRESLSMPILAVGAAFDFHAGTVRQAPRWMQDRGLEWLFRLKTNPRRLWRRYLLLNPWYVGLIIVQRVLPHRFVPSDSRNVRTISYG